ncbi:MAG TPA: addiction module protein [Candidatus Lokiarchaeia archaeon]|nr:addiction module protein [Candidatus Lokiarchaeia archaeon]
MSTIDEDLLQKVLSLSPDQRTALIDMLIESLDVPIDPEIDAAWAEEAERRAEEVRSGSVELLDGEQVFDDIRRRLKK